MLKLKVKLQENSYNIFIGNKSLDELVMILNNYELSKCLVVVDHNVEKYHKKLIQNLIALLDVKTIKYVFHSTEKNKNLNEVSKIYKILSVNGFGRDSAILAIGGGITGDLASFTASTYMRGVSFFQIPTTLLSMVDSSVGGKTGVNFNSKKNIIGSFYQPKGVFIYKDFLRTLPRSEVISGAGEMFKYAFLADENNYNTIKESLKRLFNYKFVNLDKTIKSCLEIKSNVVSQDEKEISGLRKILNLGHTFAHAFESASGFKLKHGEAVVGGIFSALFLSKDLGYLQNSKLNKILSDFSFFKPNKILKTLDENKTYELMKADKKNTAQKINLVLIEDIGKVLVDVSTDKKLIIYALRQTKNLL